MPHAVLLGDSIFDNAAYVAEGSPVIEHLRKRLPTDWQATLLARDGAVVENVPRQLQAIPDGTTHLVLSAGGNNALESAPLFRSSGADLQVLLHDLAEMQRQFQSEYRQLLRLLAHRISNIVVCTIYDAIPGLPDTDRMGLSLFNDIIVREAVLAGFPVLDLRLICDEDRAYSSISPIEPSEIGGSKIARAIALILRSHDFSLGRTVIYS